MSNLVQTISEIRSNSNLGFIKTVLAPRHFDVAPAADVDGAPSFTKRIDYTGQHHVIAVPKTAPTLADSNVELQTEAVRSDTGMVLWLTEMGVDCMFHMGFVSASENQPVEIIVPRTLDWGTSFSCRGLNVASVNLAGAIHGPPLYLNELGPGAAFRGCPSVMFQWLGPCALPRVGESVIKVSPNLAKDFSRCRLFAGVLDIESAAVPIGSTALSGELSAGCVASTRDISRNTENSVTDCYGIASLTQQSVTVHDGLKLVPVDKGITTIVGPDFPETYSAPLQLQSDSIQGEWAQYSLNTFMKYNLGQGIPNDLGTILSPRFLFSTWVSPWATNMVVGCGPSAEVPVTWMTGHYYTRPVDAAAHNQIITPPIDETGVLDVQIEVPWSYCLADPADGVNGDEMTGVVSDMILIVSAIHIFCNINADGTVNYNQFAETKQEIRSLGFNVLALANSPPVWLTTGSPDVQPNLAARAAERFMFEPRNFRRSFTDTGKYIGTFIEVSAMYNKPPPLGLPAQCFVAITSPPTLAVRARNIDKPGRVGMAHVIRYDNVALGQTINFRGQALVQCVAQGSVAPFVQTSVMKAPCAIDGSTSVLLTLLFRGGFGKFARNYVTEHYHRLVDSFFVNLSPASLKMVLDNSNDGAVVASADAAGLFGTLGGAIGGVADSLFGAGGQFGARGQFGASGQFGADAAGQYGRAVSSDSDITRGYRRSRVNMFD